MSAKAYLMQLQGQKLQLEKEIEVLNQQLEVYKAKGFDKPLVDEEGFPRQDLDFAELTVYRNLKREFAEKNNDHCALMKQIEENLYAYHAELKAQQENSLFSKLNQ